MEIGSSSTGTNPNAPAALGGTKKLPFHLQVSGFYGVIFNVYGASLLRSVDVRA